MGKNRHYDSDVQPKCLACGIDLGSTTAKLAVLDLTAVGVIQYSAYRRHNTSIRDTLRVLLEDLSDRFGDLPIRFRFTGSAALGLADQLQLPFVQEVVAASALMRTFHPDARSLIDIGGEDSKLILISSDGRLDMRMNGSCAGGTGAFIDQLAKLLGIDSTKINDTVASYREVHPIASRCGVFAKTDVQNLLSAGATIPDILASVFRAVALQTVNALARGFTVAPKVLLTGGPLTFFPVLRSMVLEAFGLEATDAVELANPELVSAIGVSFASDVEDRPISARDLGALLRSLLDSPDTQATDRDPALFESITAFKAWEATRFERIDRSYLSPQGAPIEAFLGVDAGSTTTKMVLVDSDGRILLDHYQLNHGDHLASTCDGFAIFAEAIEASGAQVRIVDAAVTGYGEDLLRSLLGFRHGVVETIAHFRAAQQVAPDVSFVLDIGGQDMKAMFIEGGMVRRIEINEACSSGCGSFLQTFADVLDLSMSQFAEIACTATQPCHLGSRCTVFMNSRVKQFLQEGAPLGDIAAGLAYAVIRNCLTKVLKIRDMSLLGHTLVVQGGTFLNPAVHRAFEQLSGARVVCPDISGLMGAYGAALVACDRRRAETEPPSQDINLKALLDVEVHVEPTITCSGCGNHCRITRLASSYGTFFSGNRCERIFMPQGGASRRGVNLVQTKHDLLFDCRFEPTDATDETLRIGLPRALNLYENLPFWATLLVECGLSVVVSNPSTRPLFERGLSSVTSDNICMPAKLANGHILDLVEQGVDRILYPRVVYERKSKTAINSFNCPIVTGYPDVIRSAIDPQNTYGIPFDTPTVTFHDVGLLRRACWRYLRQLGVSRAQFVAGFARALEEQDRFSCALSDEIDATIELAATENRPVILFVGRPYHLDPLINQGIPEKIAAMGVDVVPGSHAHEDGGLESVRVLTQWAYPNRLYQAVRSTVDRPHVEVLQVNSFGCGPDAMASDELRELLKEQGRDLTVLRVDENASPGSIHLRIRTLIEMLAVRPQCPPIDVSRRRRRFPTFLRRDRRRTILVPSLSPHLSPIIEAEFTALGYRLEVLPPADRQSLEYGLHYVNNEVCYPAILVIGDVLRALSSGKYDPSDTAVGITQTGGQCRASCYINLMTNALQAAGHDDIPTIALSMGQRGLHHQPGFRINPLTLAVRGTASLIASDAVAMMERACRVRELRPGESVALGRHLTKRWLSERCRNVSTLLSFLQEAVEAFRCIPVDIRPFPKVGLVGEIYVKYGEYSNHHIVDWLISKGVEVVIPPLFTFFFQGVRNRFHSQRVGIRRPNPFAWVLPTTEWAVQEILNRANDIMRGLPYGTEFPNLQELADEASQVIPLSSRYGEGWLLSGEMIHLTHHGAENILCLQPFGCIANQVIAKGVEKRMRTLCPSMRVLFIDLDHNTSAANVFNRVHFLVENARESSHHTRHRSPTPIITP